MIDLRLTQPVKGRLVHIHRLSNRLPVKQQRTTNPVAFTVYSSDKHQLGCLQLLVITGGQQMWLKSADGSVYEDCISCNGQQRQAATLSQMQRIGKRVHSLVISSAQGELVCHTSSQALDGGRGSFD